MAIDRDKGGGSKMEMINGVPHDGSHSPHPGLQPPLCNGACSLGDPVHVSYDPGPSGASSDAGDPHSNEGQVW